MKGVGIAGWHPLRFVPTYHERVWGGDRLAGLFGRRLPPGRRVGESWEVCDRPEAASRVAEGPLAGWTLGELMARDAVGLWGPCEKAGMRFPWLCKILDARDDLSLQVHPPAHLAGELGGEPKTEMWYVAEADPGAAVYVGVKPGTTAEEFERRCHDGTVAGLFHRLPVREGDVLFLPSGRVHALGQGLVVFEVQQNSDTTYRVFDWNRVGLDGKPRALHLGQAMRSIDFTDTEPALVSRETREDLGWRVRGLVRHELFCMDHWSGAGERQVGGGRGAWLLAVVKGRMAVGGGGVTVEAGPGDFVVVPAGLGGATLDAGAGAEWLQAVRGVEGG